MIALGLFLKLSLSNLYLILGERTVDDSKCQVEQEEGADEYQEKEEEEDETGVHFLVHDHDVGPAFQGDALEYDE